MERRRMPAPTWLTLRHQRNQRPSAHSGARRCVDDHLPKPVIETIRNHCLRPLCSDLHEPACHTPRLRFTHTSATPTPPAEFKASKPHRRVTMPGARPPRARQAWNKKPPAGDRRAPCLRLPARPGASSRSGDDRSPQPTTMSLFRQSCRCAGVSVEACTTISNAATGRSSPRMPGSTAGSSPRC
jgi:hypothetical protein